jgi:hypothetical protein
MRRLFFALSLAVAIPVFAAAPRFGEIVEAFGNLQPGPAGPVSNATFSVGHMKLTMRSGTAAPVQANGKTVAVFFKGDGTLEYEAAEPIELPVVSHNVKEQTHLKMEGTSISGPVNEVMLYGAAVNLPSVGSGGGDVAADFKSHQEEFGRERGSAPVVHSFLMQNLAFPTAKFVRAEIRSGRDELVYLYDESGVPNEDLLVLKQSTADDPTMRKWIQPIVLSEQPIGRDRKAVPVQPAMLTALDYTLIADGENAKLSTTETFTRRSEQQNAVALGLDDMYFVKAGAAWRPWHLLSVTDAQGRSLPFDHKSGEVVIGLDGVKGTTFDLKFSLEGDILIRPQNNDAWQLGVRAWFPQPDFGGQFYTVHSIVKIRKPSVAFAPGKTVKRYDEGDFSVVENVIDKPVQFAVVHGGKYEYTEETRSGLTIRVASYGGRNDRAAKQLTNLAYQIIDFYQPFLGAFPFDEFNIIQVPTWGYGQAPPGTMFITNEAFNSMTGDINKIFSQGINERFAHEIAHQYWAHVVKMPTGEEQWLTESFAEYSAALLIKKMKGEGQYERLVNGWRDNAKDIAHVAPIPLANRVTSFRDRTYLLYAKGPYLLYKLHKELGDNQFLTFLKSYQRSFQFKFGSTNDVAGLLQFVTHKDYSDFVNKYFWGTAMPD